MSREIYCGKILSRDLPEDLPEHLPIELRFRRPRRRAVIGGSVPSYGARDYSRREPQGSIVEKRRLRLASCDEALFIITTSPLDSPTASARPLPIILPSGDSWYLSRPWPTGAPRGRRSPGPTLLQAVRRHQLKFAPDKNLFSARARGGQRGMKNRSVIANLTLSGTREPFRASGQACAPRV
jgi:hypothetical protein